MIIQTDNDTLVLQSHRYPLPYPWLEACLQSVRDWSGANRFDYRFLGDELFTPVPQVIMDKCQMQKVVASDLARLLLIKSALAEGYRQVVWLDADFLIFKPDQFVLPDTPYAVGREVWVQYDKNNKLKAYKKVHNALLMFQQGNAFLDYYIETAEKFLQQSQPGVPPQFIGPKLLTALHNVVQLPVMETAAMLSPMVVMDIINGGGKALELFIDDSPTSPAGANICGSSIERNEVDNRQMDQLIEVLLKIDTIV
jgi:hypothetical protein